MSFLLPVPLNGFKSDIAAASPLSDQKEPSTDPVHKTATQAIKQLSGTKRAREESNELAQKENTSRVLRQRVAGFPWLNDRSLWKKVNFQFSEEATEIDFDALPQLPKRPVEILSANIQPSKRGLNLLEYKTATCFECKVKKQLNRREWLLAKTGHLLCKDCTEIQIRLESIKMDMLRTQLAVAEALRTRGLNGIAIPAALLFMANCPNT